MTGLVNQFLLAFNDIFLNRESRIIIYINIQGRQSAFVLSERVGKGGAGRIL